MTNKEVFDTEWFLEIVEDDESMKQTYSDWDDLQDYLEAY